jgi:hypothetical protein
VQGEDKLRQRPEEHVTVNDNFLTFPTRSEIVETWIDASPLTDPGEITRFVLFLQQVVQSNDVDMQLQTGGNYCFHVLAAPSHVLEALLQYAGSFPAEIRMSVTGRMQVRFTTEEKGDTVAAKAQTAAVTAVQPRVAVGASSANGRD